MDDITIKLCHDSEYINKFIDDNHHLPLDWHWLSYKPWDWRIISCFKSITIEFFEKYIDKYWDWSEISANKIITGKIFYQPTIDSYTILERNTAVSHLIHSLLSC